MCFVLANVLYELLFEYMTQYGRRAQRKWPEKKSSNMVPVSLIEMRGLEVLCVF